MIAGLQLLLFGHVVPPTACAGNSFEASRCDRGQRVEPIGEIGGLLERKWGGGGAKFHRRATRIREYLGRFDVRDCFEGSHVFVFSGKLEQ